MVVLPDGKTVLFYLLDIFFVIFGKEVVLPDGKTVLSFICGVTTVLLSYSVLMEIV